MKYNQEYAYAHTRLAGTYIRTKAGSGVFVERVDNNGIVHGRFVYSGKVVHKPLEEMNVDSPRLGYVNIGRTPVYTMRKPKREDWKQGLRPNNVLVCHDIYGFQDIINPLFLTTAKGKFLSFNTCLANGGAFSNQFAIQQGVLYHRGYEVGKVAGDGVQLNMNKIYLSELLEESINANP